ncbi:hypothetical protein Val02_59410 [Virgisporangium aliadipatigenens]|uniref:Uncharacterized protein n=1 Tax=Virgisporangium aliadipatigenens TaxID=741659 RepID=A0A8J3YSG9_9ACTN|nr:hypothetical protein [Virgisporangium aliadipatigenens]GIJ49055.1 hypothetical protein Val02_59410 [Virgisporangium aliadipatigenens]
MQGAQLPLWVSAAAAVLTSGLAALLVYLGLAMRRATEARLGLLEELYRRDTEARARTQAQQVCAWPVSERETYQSVIKRGIVGAAIRNGSEAPIYNVELVYHDRPAAWTCVRRLKLVRPSAEAEVHAGFDEERTLGAADPERINQDGSVRLAPSADMSLELRFTDGQGRRWLRDEAGELSEIDPSTPALPPVPEEPARRVAASASSEEPSTVG